MARGTAKGARKPTPARTSKKALYVALGVVVLAGIVVYTASRGGNEEVGAADRTCTPVSGFSDLHGLAIDPERTQILYAATHHGLVRATNDTAWCRVGSSQDDYMGFSMHPTNGSTFWVSGHPAGGGNMGVRQSTDGGYTWTYLALQGVDFHAMAVSPADPDRLWGSWQGKIYRSLDGGRVWDTIGTAPEPVRSIVGHPTDPDTVFVVGTQRVLRSTDGGATWTTLAAQPASALGIDPQDPDVMYLGLGPRLTRSTDGGATWADLALSPDGGTIAHVALGPTGSDTVYVGTYQTGIYKSTDGGTSWTSVKPPL